jgi:hypothetical protein
MTTILGLELGNFNLDFPDELLILAQDLRDPPGFPGFSVSFRRACNKWSPSVGLGGWPAGVERFAMAVTGARRVLGEGGRQRFSG